MAKVMEKVGLKRPPAAEAEAPVADKKEKGKGR
jgi:hypothetical protein